MNPWVLSGTTFLASAVEFVEAATIVLAVGVTQGWRAAAQGTFGAAIALIAVVALLGPLLIHAATIQRIEIVVGPFLVLFGTAWLRKAVWRYSGRKAMRDEAAIYAHEIATLRSNERQGIAVAFQGVFVEGLEVAVIVATFAASSPALLAWSAGGAACAFVLVGVAAIAVRTPFSRVPENVIKFVVGLMLLSLGTYWTGEGLNVAWWFGDTTLFVLLAMYVVAAFALSAFLRRSPRARAA